MIELLLGSDIGLWIVCHVDPIDVASVATRNEAIRLAAQKRGMRVSCDPMCSARVAFSAHWPTVLRPTEVERYEIAYNLHPGLLPYGRGYAPVFWALWADEPAGATLHELTAKLDGGPIIDQIPVPKDPSDTGGSLYARVLSARKELFERWWPRLAAGERPHGEPQPPGGSYHDRATFLALRDDADIGSMDPATLQRLQAALTMPGYPVPRGV